MQFGNGLLRQGQFIGAIVIVVDLFGDVEFLEILFVDGAAVGFQGGFVLLFAGVLLRLAIDEYGPVNDADGIPCNADAAFDKILTLVDRAGDDLAAVAGEPLPVVALAVADLRRGRFPRKEWLEESLAAAVFSRRCSLFRLWHSR